MPANRLSKVLAAAGVASRRACEELIVAGRVAVNGAPVLLPQHQVDPDVDHIKVDGKRLGQNPNKYYFVLNKPKGFICTNERPKNGRIVADLFPKGLPRLFTVGRLDKDTTGLLIVTNDGEFGHQVIHPSSGITKEYLVKVREELEGEAMEALKRGAVVDGVFVRPVSVVRVRRGTARVTVSEGRKHEVRILVEKARLTLVSLERIRVGSIVLGELPLGAFRPLTVPERKALLEAAAIGRAKPKRRRQVVVRRREHAASVRPGRGQDDWAQEEKEPMRGQDIGEEIISDEAIEQGAADIQWEQVTPVEQEPAEGQSPRRQKREAFMARGAENREGRPQRFGAEADQPRGGNRPMGRFSDRGESRPWGERRPAREGGPREEGRFGQGPRSGRGERRPFGERAPFGERRERPAFGERREGGFGGGERRPFGERREGGFGGGERRGFGERREGGFGGGERRGFGERREGGFGGGERRPFGERREGGFGGGERRPFGERREGGFGGGERRPFGERREGGFGGGERRPFGERRSFGDRPERGFAPRGEQGFRPRGDRPFRDGPRPARPFGGDRPFAPRQRFEGEGQPEERSPLKPRLWRSE